MCPTVAESTPFQTIGTGLKQSQLVFRISKSIVCAEGFSVGVSGSPGAGHSFKHKFQFFLFPSDIGPASWLTAERGSARIVIMQTW